MLFWRGAAHPSTGAVEIPCSEFLARSRPRAPALPGAGASRLQLFVTE